VTALHNPAARHLSRQTSSESKAQTDLHAVHDRVVTFFFLPFEIDYAIACEACGVPKETDLVTQIEVNDPIRITEVDMSGA
jgi:hypothetical protein